MVLKKIILDDWWKEIKKLRDNGSTLQKIADIYGVSRQCIQQGLARKYVKYRKA